MSDSYAKSDEKHCASDTNRATLTDAEREAIEWAILQPCSHVEDRDDTLCNLLERLK